MELLVVMTIIVILASILLPALQQARKNARYARWLMYSKNLRCESNLLTYYDFEEGEKDILTNVAVGPHGNTRYRSKRLNGTLGGDDSIGDDLPIWTTGRWKSKKALMFDGSDDYIDCGNDSSLDIDRTFTIELWFYARSWGISNEYGDFPGFVSKRETVNYMDWELYYDNHIDQTKSVKFCYGNNILYKLFTTEEKKVNPSLNKWHYLALTRSGDGFILYLDGVPRATDTCSGSIPRGDSSVRIGVLGRESDAFDGIIDEVAIYNRALTKDEIRQHYRMGRP